MYRENYCATLATSDSAFIRISRDQLEVATHGVRLTASLTKAEYQATKSLNTVSAAIPRGPMERNK